MTGIWQHLGLATQVGRRALTYLVVVGFVVILGSYIVGARAFEDLRAQQASQQRSGRQVEAKLCQDVTAMAALQPPAGPAGTNPSRGYEQAEHRTWAELTGILGCKGKASR